GDVEGQLVIERQHGAVTLIENARSAFFVAEAGDDALVRGDAVAVGLRRVRRLRKRVAQRRVETRVAAVADLRLQSVVIGLAEVHQHVDLAHAAVDGEDGTGGIRGGDASRL